MSHMTNNEPVKQQQGNCGQFVSRVLIRVIGSGRRTGVNDYMQSDNAWNGASTQSELVHLKALMDECRNPKASQLTSKKAENDGNGLVQRTESASLVPDISLWSNRHSTAD